MRFPVIVIVDAASVEGATLAPMIDETTRVDMLALVVVMLDVMMLDVRIVSNVAEGWMTGIHCPNI
jgi:hypothetical protein